MLARVLSGAILGVDAYLVRVEADVARGLPSFSTVGLPHGAVREGKDRVLAAVRNSGFELPPRRITVNLAPADIRKEGSAFDLPIALGILIGTGQLRAPPLQGHAFLGELGLDGSLRPIRGALSVALAVRAHGVRGLILPAANGAEAAVVDGIEVRGARKLEEVVAFLEGRAELPILRSVQRPGATSSAHELDLADVRGHRPAKRALEIAAAGAHALLMTGPPGSGKTMLARRLPTLLPAPTEAQLLETTRIHSVAGLLAPGASLVCEAPFRAPHHTISDAGLVGGGAHPKPGEISLAHNGILFLDELPEFRRHVLEALRQPLEHREVTITRAGRAFTFPADFMLVAAMNPCPCGYFGDALHRCTCAPAVLERYRTRLSGPLLDRIDLQIEVPTIGPAELETEATESSSAIRERVEQARQLQRVRFAGSGTRANATMTAAQLRKVCVVSPADQELLRSAAERLGLSGRGYHRVLKIARTIADLAGASQIRTEHLAEAIQYRSLDRPIRC